MASGRHLSTVWNLISACLAHIEKTMIKTLNAKTRTADLALTPQAVKLRKVAGNSSGPHPDRRQAKESNRTPKTAPTPSPGVREHKIGIYMAQKA